MTGHEGNSSFEENKIYCSPRDKSSSDLLYSWKFWRWEFIKPCCNGGHRSTFAGNSALLPSDVKDFFNVTCSEIEVTNETAEYRALLRRNFQLYNNRGYYMAARRYEISFLVVKYVWTWEDKCNFICLFVYLFIYFYFAAKAAIYMKP